MIESIAFLGTERLGFRRGIAVNSILGTERLGFRRGIAVDLIVPSLETFRLGTTRRIISDTTFLIGTSGGSAPVTVPTTGQIYPRTININ